MQSKCTLCGQMLPIAMFARDARNRSGLQSACRACQQAKYNLPAAKGARRRKSGKITAPYVPAAQMREVWRSKRLARAEAEKQAKIERAIERAKQRAARVERGSRAWYATATPEEIIAYRAMCRDRYRARYARVAADESARTRRYKQLHPDRVSQWFRTRRKREIEQGDGTLTQGLQRRMRRAASHCAYCGVTLQAAEPTIEHMVPLAAGGAHSLANVLVSCRPCNEAKHIKPLADWQAMGQPRRGDAPDA